MRRVPIDPPGGAAPALGDPANPSYSVSVSDKEAIIARAKQAEEALASRLHPLGSGPTGSLTEAVSTAFQNPAQAMIAGITGRRAGSVTSGARPSNDSMRISHESRSRNPYGAYMQARQ